MKAIFWKEIRENLKWGAIGLIGFSLALMLAWSIISNPQRDYSYSSVLSSEILMAITLCAPVIAAAIGFLQIIPEQRRDRWAFLVHRPVPCATIFWGKVAAGLGIYFAATLVPWAYLCCWASFPGHINGPFKWGMGCAGLADILACSAFYFAGMICSLRKARWLGSKGLALIGAVWLLGVADASVHFWGSLTWIGLMVATFAISARQNFLRNGVYTSQSAAGHLALTAAFTPGLCLLVMAISYFGRSMIHDTRGPGRGDSYEFTGVGEVRRVIMIGSTTTGVEDIDGHDLGLSKEELLHFRGNSSVVGPLEFQNENMQLPYRVHGSYLILTASFQEGPLWFYDRAARQLVMYDRYSRRLTGYLTPDGYHAASEGKPASTFPPGNPTTPYPSKGLMVFKTSCYLVDYENLTVRLIKETEKTEDFKGAIALPLSEEDDAPVNQSIVAVGSKEGVTFYNGSDGSKLCQVPYEEDTKTWSYVWAGRSRDGLHLLIWYYAPFPLRKAMGYKIPSYIYRYSMNGTFEKKWEIPSILQPQPPPPWTSHLWESGTTLGAQVYNAVYTWIGKQSGDSQSTEDWNEFASNWPDERIGWLVSALTGLVCACVAILLARSDRSTGREIAGWFALVLFTGIGGLLVFLAVKEWPVRVACSKCGNPRAIDSDLCGHCSAPWEAPKRDGTEIFA